jgi:hypothetical protein
MARKTMKKRTGRHHTRKRGGAINKLPGIPKGMKLRDFLSKWDVFYIRAHGGLLPSKFKVPNNTYILHTVPSSLACTFRVNSEQLDKFYEGNDETLGFEEEFMEFIEDPRSVFPFIYKNVPKKANLPDITSIYEPDDKVYDVSLSFASHTVRDENMASGGITHFIVPGIFKLPMSAEVKRERNAGFRNITSKLDMPRNRLQEELTKKDREFIAQKSNLLKGIIARNPGKYNYDLSEIISQPELQASAGKQRFIIVHACKSIIGLPPNNLAQTKKRVRSESINRIIDSNLARSLAKVSLSAPASAVAMGGPGAAMGGPGAAMGGPGAEAPAGGPGKPVKKETPFGFKSGFLLGPSKKLTKTESVPAAAPAAGEGK